MSTATAPVVSPTRILRRREIEARYGLPRSTIYDGVRAGTFPSPIRLSARSTGWIESEVESWIAHRIAVSRSAAA
jgi:prophage regulatory protein